MLVFLDMNIFVLNIILDKVLFNIVVIVFYFFDSIDIDGIKI